MKFLKIGGSVIAVGTAPLLLYILLGPADGNPIGLGLLMMCSWLVGVVFVTIGIVQWVLGRSKDRS